MTTVPDPGRDTRPASNPGRDTRPADFEDRRADYRTAWEEWQAQLARIHAFFLDGERLDPPQVKGLLNREARAKEKYDEARRKLLGLEE